MKILIIDDQRESVEGIYDKSIELGWECKIIDFFDVPRELVNFDPDIVVLDWRGDAEEIDAGKPILDNIWNVAFRPVIIFTAHADIIDVSEKTSQSNMLVVFRKGDESVVIEHIKRVAAFANAMSEFRSDLGTALIESFNSIDLLNKDNEIDDESVKFILSRRANAFFEEKYSSEASPAYIQYLCPPLNESLLAGDIIRTNKDGSDVNDCGKPEEYLLVVSPSCDMATDNNRTPKISSVLCARCFSKETFHEISLSETKDVKTENIKKVKKLLNGGNRDNYVPLPGFANQIPYMTANLKKLELINIEEIATKKTNNTNSSKYYRVASVISPFREQIIWAHLQNSCRPGVPDRNMELWAKQILSK